MRAGRVRHVHRARGRHPRALLPHAPRAPWRRGDHHRRRAGIEREARCPADRLRRGRRRAMRLLHPGNAPHRASAPRREPAPVARPDRAGDQRKSLPVHRLHGDLRGDREGRDPLVSEFSVIGRRLPKVNSWAHLTGQARYADDLFMPRMLFGRLLRSTRPHARIRRIDVSRAAAHPGVVAIVTGADMPAKMGIMPSTQDETALAVDKVRYVGEPVAAVPATAEDAAFDALSLIDIDYEDLDPIFTIEEALEREDVKIHDESKRANVFKEVHLSFGDLDGGFP